MLVTGVADCWGTDTSGELGNGTHADSLRPESVLAPA